MQKRVHLASVSFAVIFGFSFMFSKTALNIVSPIALISYRFLIAFIVFEGLRQFKVIHVRFQKVHFKQLILVALFQPVLYFLFETNGLTITSSSEAGMMIALIPIVVAILSSIILKEKPSIKQAFFIVLSVSGIVLIQLFKTNTGITIEWLGFLLLLGAVVSAALFNIASRSASKSLKPQELTYFMMLCGAVVFNSIYIFELISTRNMGSYFNVLNSSSLILSVLYLGLIASIGGFFLVNYALSHLEAHVASIYSNLATIVAIAAGALILGENLEYYHYIGSVMIIVGVYGTVKTNQHKTTTVKYPQAL